MDNSDPKPWHSALQVVVLTLLLTGILVLLVHPRAVNTNTYIDANSGDLRIETTVFGFCIRDTIKVTPFSQEVRRLGIAIQQDRHWRPVLTEEGLLMGSHTDCRLGGVPDLLGWIVSLFERGRVSDQERLVVGERILGILKNEESDRADITDELTVLSKKVNEEAK